VLGCNGGSVRWVQALALTQASHVAEGSKRFQAQVCVTDILVLDVPATDI